MFSRKLNDDTRIDRSVGAFVGLALGDAYGRPMEFVRSPEVRTMMSSTKRGEFRWTDDTHMALYLGKAVLDAPFSPFDGELFGAAVGRRFVEWLHDPLTPSTAPGGTCTRGAQKFEECLDWHRSGDPHSDGCGAVMRITPLAIAFEGDTLTEAARVSAQVTHAHPNAVAAAIAAAHLLRLVLERGLSPAVVYEVVHLLECQAPESATVIKSLKAALVLANSKSQWLDESAIPDGDGGWRSPSALGLAVASALRYPKDFIKAVDLAARINGDSDSVAALAGMYVGGSLGISALPGPWIASLPDVRDIEKLARQLTNHHQATLSSANYETTGPRERTSKNSPIGVNWLSGLSTRLNSGQGRVGLTLAPGKKGSSLYGWTWNRDLAADLERLRDVHKADMLVCLLEAKEMTELTIPDLPQAAAAIGLRFGSEPIPDLHAPSMDQALRLTSTILHAVNSGLRVVVHCRGGLGRAGTVGACCYVRLGWSAEQAIRQVRAERPRAIETSVQKQFIRQFAASLLAGNGVACRDGL